MADLVNLYSESGRNIIGDDATPTLTLTNSGTGAGLKAESSAIANAALFTKTAASAATVAVVKISSSGASAPALEFAGTCIVSTASGGATHAAKIRVKFGDTYGWIPVFSTMA